MDNAKWSVIVMILVVILMGVYNLGRMYGRHKERLVILKILLDLNDVPTKHIIVDKLEDAWNKGE